HQAAGHGHGDVHHHGGERARQNGHEHGAGAHGGGLLGLQAILLGAHAAFEDYDGVIHDHTDGDDEGRARHQVDIIAGEIQQDDRQQDRQGHADTDDQTGLQVAEED